MNHEQYNDVKTQVLLVASLIRQVDNDDLVNVLDYLQNRNVVPLFDRRGPHEIQGDTDMLKFIIVRLLDIKSVLPEAPGTGNKDTGG